MRGYVHEIFSSFQGEGPLVGRRQIFVRFSGCPLHCVYCDTPHARDFSSGTLMSESEVLRRISELRTSDLHSISFTGGEPLAQPDFLRTLASSTRKEGLTNYIETNGFNADSFSTTADLFDFASIDIKLKVHNAVPPEKYDELYRNEIETVRISVDSGVYTIVKVVILRGTPVDEIRRICDELSSFDIKFVIQPFTMSKKRRMEREQPGGAWNAVESQAEPRVEELFRISEIAGKFLRDVMVIPQMHKMLDIA